MKSISAIFSASILLATIASAHHGQDFFLVEDYQLAAVGSGQLMTSFEWEKSKAGSEFGFTPSLMFGVLPQVALGVETDFRNEIGTDWKYASVTPAAHFQLSRPDSKFPIRFGMSAGYQFGDLGSGDESSPVAHEEAGHDHAEHDHGGDEHAGTDHEEGGHAHGGSIHAHGVNAFLGRFIVEGDLGSTKVVLNLLSLVDEDQANWGYAAGVRHRFNHMLAAGVEAIGDFESHGWHELVTGAYISPLNSLTVRVGVGFGLTEATPDFTLRTGLIYRF